jgi:UDP-N-acetylmuramate: L-alanyl-gamma-D-glutamyl-meso-diaminopimelate ligase
MHIHILGICGTFMGSLALLAKQAGHQVSGCDANVYPPMSSQLEAFGIVLTVGFDAKQLQIPPDLIIVGNAMSRGNPCVEYMLDHKLPYMSGPQWLGENILRDKHVLAVAGTHGKTSTSSMLAKILDHAGLQPGFLIGGIPQDFGCSATLSDSNYFVVEADEYDSAFFDKRSKFVHYFSNTLIINNLEFDHADIFDDLNAIQRQFHHLVRTVPSNGHIILPSADIGIKGVMSQGYWSELSSFGDQKNDQWRSDILSADGSKFDIVHFDADGAEKARATVDWRHTGMHNVNNGLAATIAAYQVGVSLDQSCQALSQFVGVKRRMEVIYDDQNVVIYDDFAHHPTAIKTTLDGLRAKVGTEPILAIIEPRSATMKMGFHQDSLGTSVASADEVLWYGNSAVNWDMSALETLTVANSKVLHNLQEVIDIAIKFSQQKTHIVIMSNGGFEGIHGKLTAAFDNS